MEEAQPRLRHGVNLQLLHQPLELAGLEQRQEWGALLVNVVPRMLVHVTAQPAKQSYTALKDSR